MDTYKAAQRIVDLVLGRIDDLDEITQADRLVLIVQVELLLNELKMEEA